MKFCMLRPKVGQNGKIKYTYKDDILALALIEKYSENLDMYFYQIKNMGDSPFILKYGDGENDKEQFIDIQDIVDLGFAEYPGGKKNFYLNEEDFATIIDQNIVAYNLSKQIKIR